MKLHGIELFSNDVERTKDFYSSVIGLRTKLDEDGLKVFDPGIEGVDLNISGHYPANKISLSFLVKDLDAL
ncbi:MAG TPA: VOC family protein [Segetibacter sp.]